MQSTTDPQSQAFEFESARDQIAERVSLGRTAAFPVDTSSALESLVGRYSEIKEAIPVSFREMVPWIKGERANHYLHSYPAKLLPQIAHFFLAADAWLRKDAVVLDPFSGSGTVALEALLSGRTAYWADVNPLARLVTQVKTTSLSENTVREAYLEAVRRFERTHTAPIPDVVNIALWFETETILPLARLKRAIEGEDRVDVRNFLLISFSTLVRTCSCADPRFSVPVRSKEGILPPGKKVTDKSQVLDLFVKQVESNIGRLRSFNNLHSSLPSSYCVGDNARKLLSPSSDPSHREVLRANSVDLVLTSPPYAGAQKYIRSSSLNIGWLDLAAAHDLKQLEGESIGREHFPKKISSELIKTGMESADQFIEHVFKINSTRAAIISHYLLEMRVVINELFRVLKPSGTLILVVGNNQVCGMQFATAQHLADIAREQGFIMQLELVDAIKGRSLMTKRRASSGVITKEWIMLLQKPPV